MAFKGGRMKTGGRRAGTPNKDSALYSIIVSLIIEGQFEKLRNELEKLNGMEYINAIIHIGKTINKTNNYTFLNEILFDLIKTQIKTKK